MTPRPSFTLSLPGNRILQLGARTLVMGILNITPDSFADGGLLLDPGAAEAAALEMETGGADLIDIGGESTRPGTECRPGTGGDCADPAGPQAACAGSLRIPISVDTSKAAVAEVALDEGATLVNDVTGLRYDSALAELPRDRALGSF